MIKEKPQHCMKFELFADGQKIATSFDKIPASWLKKERLKGVEIKSENVLATYCENTKTWTEVSGG